MATKTRRPAGKTAITAAATTSAAKRSAAASTAAPDLSGSASPKADKQRKKMVRDSFAMPADDFALIATLKSRALDAKRPAKKSELLRAGLHALAALKPTELVSKLDKLAPVKTGRPQKI